MGAGAWAFTGAGLRLSVELITTSLAAGKGTRAGAGLVAATVAAGGLGATGATGVTVVTGVTGVAGTAATGAEAAGVIGAATTGAVTTLGAEAPAAGLLTAGWGLGAIKGLSPTRSFFQILESSEGELRPP